MKYDFSEFTVLVTGATRGIGKQIADDLAELGANLILTGTNLEQIIELNRNTPENVNYICVNFVDKESTNDFLSELDKYDRIDACVNCAGINRINNIDETRVEDWDDIIAVNLTAPFKIIRKISRKMKDNKYGRIVNIGSIFGVVSKEKRSIYSASKFGLHGLTVALSNELSRYNVLVNTVSPGFVDTDLTRAVLGEEQMEHMRNIVPQKRLAQPSDISRAVLFLISPYNTYTTGHNMMVDGGFVNQ